MSLHVAHHGSDQCPLCGKGDLKPCHHSPRPYARVFFHCPNCSLISVPPPFHLSPQKEKARYQEHQNELEDPGYRKFLEQAALPLLEKLEGPQKGLDYGCGPGPLLVQMMVEKGHDMQGYDPFFNNEKALLDKKYDFISCTETAEHFSRPLEELRRIEGMLRDGGVFVLMTQTWDTLERFESWYYHRDPTHICFFHHLTFEWIAQHLGWEMEMSSKNVVLFTKS